MLLATFCLKGLIEPTIPFLSTLLSIAVVLFIFQGDAAITKRKATKGYSLAGAHLKKMGQIVIVSSIATILFDIIILGFNCSGPVVTIFFCVANALVVILDFSFIVALADPKYLPELRENLKKTAKDSDDK